MARVNLFIHFRELQNVRDFMGWQTVSSFERALLGAGYKIKSMPIWVKNNFGIGYYTRPQYEPMYLCFKGTPETLDPLACLFETIRRDLHSYKVPPGFYGNNFGPTSKYSTLTMDDEHEVHTFQEARRVRDNFYNRLIYHALLTLCISKTAFFFWPVALAFSPRRW